ncbi:hypothetical protein PYJP_07500 [Pyrofollis japonicus]|uniref:hypothetical protein n=1 Tax=Pyrofollis japonicus TaxID=3060460 RepID=UPI00295B52B2|nr:hypothetical protein [Pyrofollis japonicus]BEP17398.1 hypothetical protein PYJP_07500 [Pyrofollis japonicus]
MTLPRERRFKLLIAIAFAAIVLISASSHLSRAADELQILFNNYVKGKESAIINLHVEVPKVNADWCTVYVARFPTPSNPVKKGGLELVALKRTRPGQSVVVKSFIENAIPVAYKRDPDIGALKILYREPQEYLISVKCYKKISDRKARLVGAYTRIHIHEVRIKKPIMSVEINAGLAQPKPVKPKPVSIKKRDYGTLNLGSAPNYVSCNFGNSDVCVASTRLAKLNSIPGLEVTYKLELNPPSAVYLSSYMSDCVEYDLLTCECSQWGSWTESGKKLTPSNVVDAPGTNPGSVSDGEKGYVYGFVEYAKEYIPGSSDGFAGVCYLGPSYLVYPVQINDYDGVYQVGYYVQPSSPPPYATGPVKGSRGHPFADYRDKVRETDEKIGVSTSISFCANAWQAIGLCGSLNIDVYKAGRHDSQYTTPLFFIYDRSGRDFGWYYWWFKDNDPMTYEVMFYTPFQS